MNKTIALLACSEAKLNHAAPTKDFYQSRIFKACREYFELVDREWYVISGKHGLLNPDEIVEPYEVVRLSSSPRAYVFYVMRYLVYPRLTEILEPQTVVELYMGRRYAHFLIEWLRRDGYKVTLPFYGLDGIGECMSSIEEQIWKIKLQRGMLPFQEND